MGKKGNFGQGLLIQEWIHADFPWKVGEKGEIWEWGEVGISGDSGKNLWNLSQTSLGFGEFGVFLALGVWDLREFGNAGGGK